MLDKYLTDVTVLLKLCFPLILSEVSVETLSTMVSSSITSTALLAFVPWAQAQFPPEPKGITVLKSQFDDNVTISYKEVPLPSRPLHRTHPLI